MAPKPSDEAGPVEAPIGQDYGANPDRQYPYYDSQESLLLELVLALGGRQTVPIVGQLQKGQRPFFAGYGDPQNTC